MNDTKKMAHILSVFSKGKPLGSSEVAALSPEKQSLVTVKRQLSILTKNSYLDQTGAGRSVKYTLSKKGWLLRNFDTRTYLQANPDDRLASNHFQFDVFNPPYILLFYDDEISALEQATKTFRLNASKNDPALYKKELMRFIVEFSWKSSQIEGNTYDLISTERLLVYGEKSPTNTEYETQMILNQKSALDFILENIEIWKNPTIAAIEMLHSHVANRLDISTNLRNSIVGITGTNYRPLENEFQIREALESFLQALGNANNVYEKALLGVLGLSYIQPFVDGNKRTSRLLSNAILLADGFAPLSYRSVDDRYYKETCLVFYEQNSIGPFKQLFFEQYLFSANNYNIATP